MLKFLRKKDIAKKIFLVLAIIIIPAFVFWDIGPGSREKKYSNYIGKISGQKIDITRFKNAYRTILVQASLRFGDEFRKVEPFLNLSEQAWDRLILLKETSRRNIYIKDTEIIKFVREMPLFQKNKQFDNKIYAHVLGYLRITPREFEEQIRDTLKIEKLYKQITDAIKIDDKEAFEIYKDKNDMVKIDYVGFLIKHFKQKVKFEEKDLKDFYNKNSSGFFIPLAINLEYFSIGSDKIKRLEKIMHQQKEIRVIAKEVGIELKETGIFDIQNPPLELEIPKEIIQKIASFKLGQIQLLENEKKIYLISLKDKRQDFLLDFNKVKDDVKEMFIDLKAKELAKKQAQSTLEAFKKYPIHNETNFIKAAKSINLTIQTPKEFTKEDYIENVGINKNFNDTAFNMALNSVSEIIDTPNGYFIIFKKDFIFADEKKFNSELEKLKQTYLDEKKQKAFDDFFKSLKSHTQLYTLPK